MTRKEYNSSNLIPGQTLYRGKKHTHAVKYIGRTSTDGVIYEDPALPGKKLVVTYRFIYL